MQHIGPSRNRASHNHRELLRHREHPHFRRHRFKGPLPFLNPTRVHFAVDDTQHHGQGAVPGIFYKWTSRNNRKGRHAIRLDQSALENAKGVQVQFLQPPGHRPGIACAFARIFSQFPVWDISYLVALIFTAGSVIWVINGFFVFLPLIMPSSEFHNEILYGGGTTAFIGATIFEVGSILLMLEAVNENRAGCFGWALSIVFDQQGSNHSSSQPALDAEKSIYTVQLTPKRSACEHHHANTRNLVGQNQHGASTNSDPNGEKSWCWFPSYTQLRTHYAYELGFWACLIQLVAATIFWIAGFAALPGIYNHMADGLIDGVYWTPQVVGGLGFIVSGFLFMLETQTHWLKPALGQLGWHFGAWNMLGGVGFTLSPAFGYDMAATWAQYQAACSTFWGSWAFLVGSLLQYYESLEKHPVETRRGSPKRNMVDQEANVDDVQAGE
ncbi:integral membrane protein [Phyllosticta citricarpa]